jgi:hypothetical protein
MALVCDYCGDVTEAENRVQVAFGHNQEIALKGATAKEWFYYCDGECADAVSAMLGNLRLFAMHGEGSGLTWQLVEQKVAPVATAVKPSGEPPEEATDPREPPRASEPRRQKRREALERNPEARERLGNLSLTWFLKRETSIPITELSARQAAGISVSGFLAAKGNGVAAMHGAGIATLEDVAAMTGVEFLGLPGVGPKVAGRVAKGMEKHGLKFKPGPTLNQLGIVLRSKREEAGLTIEDLIAPVLGELDAPERRTDIDCRSSAHGGVENMIRDGERGGKPIAPLVLDVVADCLGTTRQGMLAEAMQVDVG